MRAIVLSVVGAVLLTASFVVIAVAMTPQVCDQLAAWVYAQAEVRDSNQVSRAEHETAVRRANREHRDDVLALLLHELAKVYDEAKAPIVAATDARFECYARKGEIEGWI